MDGSAGFPSRYSLLARKFARLFRRAQEQPLTRQEVERLVSEVAHYLGQIDHDAAAQVMGIDALRLNLRQLTERLRAAAPGMADTMIARVLEGLPDHVASDGMRFSIDLFAVHIPRWRKLFEPLAGKAGLNFLEVGSFEGRSACWLLRQVLTHPRSRLLCIDTFDLAGQPAAIERGDSISLEARFDRNVVAAGGSGRVEKRVGTSASILPTLEAEHFDFVYIDGSHHPRDVLADAVMAWRLLKPGALMTFDDYGSVSVDELMPKKALDAFMDCYRGEYETTHKGYQLTLRKMHRR